MAVPGAFAEEVERGVRVLRGEGLTVTIHGAKARARDEVAKGLRVQLEALPGARVEETSAAADELRYHAIAVAEERLQLALLSETGVLHVAVFGAGPWDAARAALADRIAASATFAP